MLPGDDSGSAWWCKAMRRWWRVSVRVGSERWAVSVLCSIGGRRSGRSVSCNKACASEGREVISSWVWVDRAAWPSISLTAPR